MDYSERIKKKIIAADKTIIQTMKLMDDACTKLFLVFEGEKFITEACVWDAIAADGYKLRWYNYPLMVCKYLDDGLSFQVRNNDLQFNNFEGHTYATKVRMNARKGLQKYKMLWGYIQQARKKGLNDHEIAKKMGVSPLMIVSLETAVKIKGIVLRGVRK